MNSPTKRTRPSKPKSAPPRRKSKSPSPRTRKTKPKRLLLEAIKLLDQCEGAHIIAKNNCNRKKSHLQKLVNGLK
jgi:ribosomal protein S20